MCTLTYVQQSGHDFILTSNRDESPRRAAASPPAVKEVGQTKVLAPIDQEAGGTWIAVSQAGRIVCLLNGAFGRYQHSPPYRKSRGKVVLDTFCYDNLSRFVSEYNFQNIAPFMMIIKEPSYLRVVKWDGHRVYSKQIKDGSPFLACSPHLYSRKQEKRRKLHFRDWIREHSPTPEHLLRFHQLTSTDKQRPNIRLTTGEKPVRTLSSTCIYRSNNTFHMIYRDYLQDTHTQEQLKLVS